MKRKHILLIVFSALYLASAGQHNVLKQLIKSDSFYVKYAKVLADPHKYHLQVIFTQIIRDSNNFPHLHKYFLTPRTESYFYPASLVKLPLVALALEKIDSLHIAGLTRDSRLSVDSAWYCQTREFRDTTAKNRYPSIAHFIKKMLLVSDNYSYNRIYEFLGPARINRRLHELGYSRAMVNQRFTGACDSNCNRVTNPFTFYSDSGTVIYKQDKDSNGASINNVARNTVLGKGFMSNDGKKVLPPRDFRRNNYIPFESMNEILLSLIFPQCFDSTKRFNLTPDDYGFLHKYMSMLPRESDYPHYLYKDYKDDYKKYIYFGTDSTISDTSVRSFNIVGRAYGFISDCAYICDVKDSVEFCLSVLMYANEKNILNTDNYQYDDLALPFMSDLGHLLFNHELKRKKKHKPDLSAFKLHYP